MKFTGTVQSDAQIGRTFGVATANLAFDKRPELEAGVYLVDVTFGDQATEGLLHFGERKTFGSGFSAEVHILDFDQDLYGQELKIETLKYLRDIIEFTNSDALFTQIETDIIKAHKFFTRRAIKNKWQAVSSEQRAEMSEAAHKQVVALPEFTNSKVIYAYAPDAQEIPFIEKLMTDYPEKVWCFPRVHTPLEKGGPGGVMEFFTVDSFNELSPGAFGLLEPLVRTLEFELSPNPDLILVPAVAGTLEGQRLGRGGGFYDRFLSQSPFSRGTQGVYTLSVLPSFAIKSSLELEKHDQGLDKIVIV